MKLGNYMDGLCSNALLGIEVGGLEVVVVGLMLVL